LLWLVFGSTAELALTKVMEQRTGLVLDQMESTATQVQALLVQVEGVSLKSDDCINAVRCFGCFDRLAIMMRHSDSLHPAFPLYLPPSLRRIGA
jgi:hypothetical protein